MINWLNSLGITIGSAGIWALVIMGLVAWWKGLPTLISALTKRTIDLEAKIQASMDAYIERNDREIAKVLEKLAQTEAEHENCKNRQKQTDQEVSRLHDEILGLKRQIAAYQMAMVEHGLELPPATKAAMERMGIIGNEH